MKENRIKKVFQSTSNGVLSMYFTAGFPKLQDTRDILGALSQAGADIIEIGIPFSDPVADGPTIQASNQQALENGMTLRLLFEQLEGFRQTVTCPVLLMGYFNPILQFGVEAFCQKCQALGIDGVIIPDLPLAEFDQHYRQLFSKYGLLNIFLITPQTSPERIRAIDQLSEGFIYMVATAGTTGARVGLGEDQLKYFDRIHAMNLQNPRLIGFGIASHETFQQACQFAQGAIIGSAFIKALAQSADVVTTARQFVQDIKKNPTPLNASNR
jgi:tryptophan synthase alpha chain